MPIRLSMHAAAAEPISPELVLVCPELRERALETAQRVQSHPVLTHASRSYVVAVHDLAGTVRMGLSAFGSVTLVTLVLTLIADALH
jgi:hypothetical protein